ncbi:hypothetical protein M2212_002917 [Bradyrhizobium elkanii]|uniref:hypothetical protein n=1 Tax=Bradyrhizobium elkanii TaxID=29448 RepID=UPI00216956A8|nr:hypothetical protein [Bradyrhizobium elkanii]MCS3476071.1 hypothetical protein [Bradyrhizobium elkanii]
MSIANALATLGQWLLLYPILDFGIGALWARLVVDAWREQPDLSEEQRQRRQLAEEAAQLPEERRLGVMVILGEIQYLVVATAVILSGVAAFAALAISRNASNEAKHCIGYAAAWALFTLIGGVYATSVLPHHTLSRNFVLVPNVNRLLGVALFMFIAAAARLLVGVLLVLVQRVPSP